LEGFHEGLEKSPSIPLFHRGRSRGLFPGGDFRENAVDPSRYARMISAPGIVSISEIPMRLKEKLRKIISRAVVGG
jgi:hypothetical protein